MKNILIATALIAASASAAQAEVNIGVGLGQPYYQPYYVAPSHNVVYYNDRNYDWNYWRSSPRPVVVERNTYIYDNDRYNDRGRGPGRYGNKHNRGHHHH